MGKSLWSISGRDSLPSVSLTNGRPSENFGHGRTRNGGPNQMPDQEQADLEETDRLIAYLEAGLTEAELEWVDQAEAVVVALARDGWTLDQALAWLSRLDQQG